MKKKIFCLYVVGLFNIPFSRTTAPLTCPVCDKASLVRLDKHLLDTHYMIAEVREYKIYNACKFKF